MFFDLVLLNKQHKSRFGFAWIAATRGIQHLPKRVILELDTSKLCDDIMEYVNSDSDSPRSRFSLRLSAFLINGTMKIHRQKAIFFLDDVVEVFTAVSRPHFLHVEIKGKGGPAIFDTPSTPVPRRKSKKNRVLTEKNTPLSELDNLVAALKTQESELLALPEPGTDILKARTVDVTIRESQIQSQGAEAGADFGDLGTFQLLDRQMLQAESSPARELFPPLSEKIWDLQPQESSQEIVHSNLEDLLPARTRRHSIESTTSSLEPQTRPTKLTVQAQVHASSELGIQQEPQQRETIVQPREDVISEVQVEPTIPTETPVLKEVQLESLEERELTTEKKKKKEPKDEFKIQLKEKAFKFARIDRPLVVKKNDYPEPLFEVKIKVLRITNLLNTYMVKSDRITETVRKISDEITPRDSLLLPRRSLRETPPVEVSTREQVVPAILEEQGEQMALHETPQIPSHSAVPQPLLTSTPIATRAPHTIEKTLEEVMAVAGEQQFVSPRKRRRLLDKEEIPTAKDLAFITLPTEIQTRELTGSVLSLQQETVESVSIPVINEQNRQQDIVNKILVHQRLTLEEVCQKPINKLNIARAFNDVLVLCKHGYVTLTREEDSSELKFIEKGPKMNR